MASWIAGYTLLEGPEQTKAKDRFRGLREADSLPAWIRVDGHAPDDRETALAIAAAYDATARLDHPDLPRVLDYGATTIAGRPFIAFQLTPERARSLPDPAGALSLLAEMQLLAYEAGTAGLYVPEAELERARRGVILQDRRLPIREFLCEPRRADGTSGLEGVEPDDLRAPFTAPELLLETPPAKLSIQKAVVYRLGAQAKALGGGDRGLDARGGVFSAERARLIRAALEADPARRPELELFLMSPAGARAAAPKEARTGG